MIYNVAGNVMYCRKCKLWKMYCLEMYAHWRLE